MAVRYFRNGPRTTLSGPISTSSATSATVIDASVFPTQFPYTLILDPDTSTEEVVDVTAATGNTLTIVRGVDSTTAVAHANGAVVFHGVSARDMREANSHVNQTADVHGGTGAPLDTGSVQTIAGQKTFNGGLLTPGGQVVDVGSVQTVTGAKTLSGNNTYSGNNTISGANTFSGNNSHSGIETFTNNVSIDGSNVDGAWLAYTPAWRNGSLGPALGVGNGTLVGKYKKISKTVVFRIMLKRGTTTEVGSTDYVFTLPLPPLDSQNCGTAILYDDVPFPSKWFMKSWHSFAAGGSTEVYILAEDGTRASGSGGGTPIAWAVNDQIFLCGSYEAA